MRRSNSSIDLEDIELAGQIVRHDPSTHETPHHLHEGAEAPAYAYGHRMRRRCPSDWRTLRADGFRRRRSLVRSPSLRTRHLQGSIQFAALWRIAHRGSGKLAPRERSSALALRLASALP